jgi:hypothetical protein
MEWLGVPGRSRGELMDAMHQEAEQISAWVKLRTVRFVRCRQTNLAKRIRLKASKESSPMGMRGKAVPAAAVMLHLRSCYVSKAAILTLPILFVPVENRSPA